MFPWDTHFRWCVVHAYLISKKNTTNTQGYIYIFFEILYLNYFEVIYLSFYFSKHRSNNAKKHRGFSPHLAFLGKFLFWSVCGLWGDRFFFSRHGVS